MKEDILRKLLSNIAACLITVDFKASYTSGLVSYKLILNESYTLYQSPSTLLCERLAITPRYYFSYIKANETISITKQQYNLLINSIEDYLQLPIETLTFGNFHHDLS